VASSVEQRRQYAGFWIRLGSMLLDGVVLLPVLSLQLWFGNHYRMFRIYWWLPSLAFLGWYHVLLVARYGATPGKLFLGLRIALVNGGPITLRAAARRYSVQFVLSAASALGLALGALAMTDVSFHAFGMMARGRELALLAPPWHSVARVLAVLWFWGELLTMLTNDERRAVHDFIGGTVVLNEGRETLLEGQLE